MLKNMETASPNGLDVNQILKTLSQYRQEHLLSYYNNLDKQQQVGLLNTLDGIDWSYLTDIFEKQVRSQLDQHRNIKPGVKLMDDELEPLPNDCIEGTYRSSFQLIEEYRARGLSEIRQGRVAALVMAAGQGTRLGVNYPKGVYEINLGTPKSLFQLQAERIKKLMTVSGATKPLVWYVMTSESTTQPTKTYFSENNYFGLNRNDVVFFEQNNIPSFDLNGKILLDTQSSIAKSPNGNGGIFEVLHERGIIEDMMKRGIEHVHVHSVDNVLVRVCDPVYMGYCISKGADAGAKVVEKIDPNEAVGTICKYKGKFNVIEYSEIPEHLSKLRDSASGKLIYSSGNICDQYFGVKFLNSIKNSQLDYHVAIKKIPNIDLATGERVKPEKANGIKLEKFIFDVFRLTDRFVCWEVSRDDEFSPVKNAPGSGKDNPETALAALERAYEKGLLDD